MYDKKGVYPIVPTPFTDQGALDLDSWRRLVDYQKTTGVNGIAALGFMGESHKLSESERQSALTTAVQQAAGDLEVWVGVRALGTMGSIEQAKVAQDGGADQVFVAPIGIQNDNALYDHYAAVKEAVSIPVMIHDFPASFGTVLSADLIARLGRDGICPSIKLEEEPVGPKVTRIKELAGDDMTVFGGLGGRYFLEELERGASGIATGFSYAEVLVEIYQLYSSGQSEAAAQVFDRYAPLIRYEFQPNIGLAFRKHIYQRRGIFTSTYIRPPGPKIDAYTVAELERTVARAGLSLEA